MEAYEYKKLYYDNLSQMKALNELGAKGWHVISYNSGTVILGRKHPSMLHLIHKQQEERENSREFEE